MTPVRRLLARPEAALLLLLLASYAYFYQAGGWNQNSRFDMVRAAVEQRSLRIDRYQRNTGDKARREGHFYCDKAPGAQWLGLPAYAAAHAIAGSPRPSPRFLAVSAHLTTLFAVGLPTALAVLALFWLAQALGLGRAAAAGLAIAYGLGTLAWPFATLLYGHQLTAALLLAAFWLLVRARVRGGPPGRVAMTAVGLLLGYAVAVEYTAALAGLVLFVYAAVTLRPWQRLGWIVAGALPPALAVALYHAAAFGSPLALPYQFSTQKHRHMGWFMGLGEPAPRALWHILLSSYRGLFFSAPWLLAAVPGAVLLLRDRARRAEGVVCVTIFVLFVWLNASLVDWEGGWTMGPRYLVPAIPFVAVAAAGLAIGGGRRALLGLAGAAAALSVFLMLVGTAVKPEAPVYVKHPFGDYLFPSFFAGRIAISTQSIDSAVMVKGGPRQAWNLGQQLLGLDGLPSLLPLLVVWGLCGWWLWRTLRPSGEAGGA